MNKITFISLVLCYSLSLTAQNFDKVPSTNNLKGGYLGNASFVDYNKDGFLDIFVTGLDFGPNGDFRNAILYKNNGDKTFTESNIKNIPRSVYGDNSWADFNNDGTLDLLYAGTTSGFSENNITRIYKNIDNGCAFVEVATTIPKIKNGSVQWVDVNNDGLLDVFYLGTNSSDKFDLGIYKNNGNENFTKVDNINLYTISGEAANVQKNTAKWADFDGDGLKDVIVASSTKTEREFAIYKNLGDFKFQKVNFSLPQLSYVTMDIGDINKDGLPDFVFTGIPEYNVYSGQPNTKLYFYINKGNMDFRNSSILNNDGAILSQLKFGDFDNDGFLDLINYGSGESFRITKFYVNNKNDTFTEVYSPFPNCYSGGIDFGDFDNDNDLDLLYYGRIENPRDDEITYIYENKKVTIDLPSEIIFDNGCGCSLQSAFSLNNSVDSVRWNFGDVATGALNFSVQSLPTHLFSHTGVFTVTATYTKGGATNTIVKTVSIVIPPIVKKPAALVLCESDNIVNFHALKDTEILNGLSQSDYQISYHLSFNDADKNVSALSDTFTVETLTQSVFVRVQNKLKSNCYIVTDFKIDILLSPVPNHFDDLYVCDDNGNGFSSFDLSTINAILLQNQSNIAIKYFDSNNNSLAIPLSSNYSNLVANSDYITAKISHSRNNCLVEKRIKLIVSPLPLVNSLDVLVGCDDNNDGISEYFDTSEIEKKLIGNQIGVTVSYYDSFGNSLSSPIANPFTNTIRYNETIVVRVTDQNTNCFAEANLVLETSSKPKINKPTTLYACDEGNGYGYFDTSTIESQLIGNQSGLTIFYKDASGAKLTTPLPISFKNTSANIQTIYVKVENSINPLCFSETNFNLEINKFPEIELEKSYSICELEPSLTIAINPNLSSYEWKYENGAIISLTNQAELTKTGSYIINLKKTDKGVSCEKSFSFDLKKSLKPTIEKVNYNQFGNNFIEIIPFGTGNFEYSIDGLNFQGSNLFNTISEWNYTVHLRDKDGCGEALHEITILDYPRFFTPNNDGYNDIWQIKNLSKYPNAQISIFDRFGKLIIKLSAMDNGWDGKYNGELLFSDDYWFLLNLGNEINVFKSHFSLKR